MELVREEVSFVGHGGDGIVGRLTRRGDADGAPGIVLVHDHPEAAVPAADLLAGEGWVVLAPELAARNGERAPVSDRRVPADLDGALRHLTERGDVDPGRLAAIGFGAGGNHVYLLGCHSTRLAALVDVDGPVVYPELGPDRPVQPLELALNLSCPLLGFFSDAVPAEDVDALRRVLSQFSREFDIVARSTAGPRLSEEEWRRALEFLAESCGS